MPLRTASSSAASSSGSSRPAARRTMSSSNSAPAAAASSSRSVVAGASRASRWLTTSRTLSGVPSSASGRVTRMAPSTTSTASVSTSARHSSQTRNGLPVGQLADRVRELGAAAPGRRRGAARRTPRPRRRESPASRSRTTSSERRRSASVSESASGTSASVSRNVASSSSARAAGARAQVAQQQQRRGVGPVHVLEHEQHRPAADAGEQVGHRRVQPVALGVRIGLHRRRQIADPGRQIGEQPRQLAAGGAERGAQLGRARATRARWSSASTNGAVRRAHDGVAGAVEDERAVRRPPRAANSRTSRLLPEPGSPPSSTTRRPSPVAPSAAARAACPARPRGRRTGTSTSGGAGREARAYRSLADDSQI